jgi:16S rRNA A1518/A1519 N6-dimethyltransferase RsmA/KsgA/DIM1 with predicted DNA glycosylase/AP lyase activity
MLYSLQQRDFLTTPLEKIFNGEYAVIGNFPYNISSQIFFRILDYKESVPQVVCMLQKEVAERMLFAAKGLVYNKNDVIHNGIIYITPGADRGSYTATVGGHGLCIKNSNDGEGAIISLLKE